MRLHSNATVAHSRRIFNGEGGLPAGVISSSDLFGVGSDAGIGDVDGDGFNDIIVGAPTMDAGGTDYGALFVLFMRGNDTVREYTRISRASGEGLDGIAGFGA